VSPFGAAERTWKPFNPLLGETFELEGLGSDVAFMAEQVTSSCCFVKLVSAGASNGSDI
jgi:hypothetical protein